jgi:hypothetical protein
MINLKKFYNFINGYVSYVPSYINVIFTSLFAIVSYQVLKTLTPNVPLVFRVLLIATLLIFCLFFMGFIFSLIGFKKMDASGQKTKQNGT